MNMNFQNMSNIKNKIFWMVKRDYISNEDLEFLYQKDFIDMQRYASENNFNHYMLFQIYLNPYLLCDDRLLEKRNNFLDVDVLSKLLIKRYNEELREYKVKYKDGEISEGELNNNTLYLKNLYFTSTNIGKMIYIKYSDQILKVDNGNIFLQDKGNILLKKKKNHDKI